jgi:hypothetical protein
MKTGAKAYKFRKAKSQKNMPERDKEKAKELFININQDNRQIKKQEKV